MKKTKPLTKAERAWLAEVQDLLNRCPSNRIAFYTTGDHDVGLHDASRENEIADFLDNSYGEWSSAAARIGADFDGAKLVFPNAVHSTAG